jgi:Protein of unknown function (DUF3987)
MQTQINFLKAIGHIDRVYIRCLSPKNTPLSELAALGMTYQDKSGQTKKSTVNGYIDLQTGEFYRRYGKDYKPVTDGWGHLLELNQQGYGIYFVVGHGGERNSNITHGSTLFHESDRATLEHQQLEIDRIFSDFGKPTAVVQTKKSLHADWASSETIAIYSLPTFQRRWLQYSNCDDSSLADPAQLMRLPGFEHLAWNPETQDFDRVQCELLQLNGVSYSLAEFDRILPLMDIDRWCKKSLEIVESDANDRDIRTLAQYLPSGTNFNVPAIRWCGLVGDTDSKKSPVISLLTDPLSRQQIELYDDYKEKKLDYDAEFTNWKNMRPADRGEQPAAPTPMLDLYFSNFTIEALVDSIQHHPDSGCMLMLDELAQFYRTHLGSLN